MLIIARPDGHLLLHHRDDRPGVVHPGCWAGFGGALERGESALDAVRREVFEETGLDVRDPLFLCHEVDAEGQGDRVTLFYVVGPYEPADVVLTEGQGVALVGRDEVALLPLTPFVRRAIERCLPARLSILKARGDG